VIALKDYKQFISRDPKLNSAKRDELLRAAYHDEALQDLLMRLCKADIFFWIDLFVYQMNPRRVGHEPSPFICYDFQREAVRQTKQWLAEQEDVIWEKSRYLGATWLALLMQIHDCLFFDYKKFLDISHTANAVDASDDPDSLFWKVQFVLELLPDWMRRSDSGRA
jgi:hypothetical protein